LKIPEKKKIHGSSCDFGRRRACHHCRFTGAGHWLFSFTLRNLILYLQTLLSLTGKQLWEKSLPLGNKISICTHGVWTMPVPM
jgi:hypothetical protein